MNIFKFFFFGKAILFLVQSALDVWIQFSYIRNSLREAKWIKQNWAKYHPFGSYAKFFWKTLHFLPQWNWAEYHPFGSYAKFFWKLYISYPLDTQICTRTCVLGG